MQFCIQDPDFSKPLVSYIELEQLFDAYIATPKPLLPLTVAVLRSFHTVINCHMCNQPLGSDKVSDHRHILGYYRGATRSRCNLMYRISKSGWQLPVHNLKGYDRHLIVKGVGE